MSESVYTDVESLVQEQLEQLSPTERTILARRLERLVAAYLPKPQSQPANKGPMTDEEAKRFALTPMPFGVYVKTPVRDVPFSTLEWYADQHFVDELRRYLHNPTVMHDRECDRDREDASDD